MAVGDVPVCSDGKGKNTQVVAASWQWTECCMRMRIYYTMHIPLLSSGRGYFEMPTTIRSRYFRSSRVVTMTTRLLLPSALVEETSTWRLTHSFGGDLCCGVRAVGRRWPGRAP